MNPNLHMTIIWLFCCSFLRSCAQEPDPRPGGAGPQARRSEPNPYHDIGSIPTPAGYQRIPGNSFAAWLRSIPLKKNRTVYLYNGMPKRNQDAQFAVLDVSTGREDLQQCADAVMRLRAEFLYSKGDFSNIDFVTGPGVYLNFGKWAGSHTGGSSRESFDAFLKNVFTWCGTLSLERQLHRLPGEKDLLPGDVLIQGGSPGHAMLVVDLAQDKTGRKCYLLAQSYMPAQDIHIVKNSYEGGPDPWYRLDEKPVYTPEWDFPPGHFRRWSVTN